MEFIIILLFIDKNRRIGEKKNKCSLRSFDTRTLYAYWMYNFSIYILRLEIEMMIRWWCRIDNNMQEYIFQWSVSSTYLGANKCVCTTFNWMISFQFSCDVTWREIEREEKISRPDVKPFEIFGCLRSRSFVFSVCGRLLHSNFQWPPPDDHSQRVHIVNANWIYCV